MEDMRAPQREDYEDIRDFIAAHEKFHDEHPPTELAILERAVRLGSDSLWGLQVQVRRLRSKEPEDEEWWARLWLDFQFLIVVLWRMRQSGVLAASADVERELILDGLGAFDAVLPHLKRMRDVAQHFDEYAIDGPGRRHKRPGKNAKVGRRLLEVGTLGTDGVQWLEGAIEFKSAETASWDLYTLIQRVRDRARAEFASAAP